MHLPLLQDLVILLACSIAIVFVLNRLKVPSILGFLLTGVIIGPHGLSLIEAVEEVEIISEIGVILLLFVIGLEMSIKQLISIRKTVFVGGALQVGVTVVVAFLVYYLLGNSLQESVFIGFLFSLSSTAIVLKVFQDRNELNTPHGKNALAILIFQDLIVVPMMLVTPIIAGETENLTQSILSLLLKTVIVIVITIISARYLVPRLMHSIAKTESKELFLLTTFTICFAVAFLTSEAGLSLALGAFLAGLIISESEYSHQATSTILPFGELFTSLFFISIGMLLNLTFFINNIGLVLLILGAVFVGKSLITALAIAILQYPPRTIIITALSLFQVGEFSFILSKVGIQYNLLSESTNQIFLAVSILSMLITPFVIIISEKVAFGVLNMGSLKRYAKNDESAEEHPMLFKNHLVIMGFGVNGANLVKAAEYIKIPYVIIEKDKTKLKDLESRDIPFILGDATQDDILNKLNLTQARALVIAISDREATKQIMSKVRQFSQSLYTIVRTRYIMDIEELHACGADEVIPEEFETSIEIFTKVMHNFLIPKKEIDSFTDSLRTNDYDFFQSKSSRPKTYHLPEIPEFNITTLQVNCDSGKILRKSIRELDIRHVYGINILSIKRQGYILNQVSPEEVIERGDILFVQGNIEHIENFSKLL